VGHFVVDGGYDPGMRDEDGISRDANGYAYDRGITSEIARHQRVLNQSWPQQDAKGFHARGIRPARHDDGSLWTIDVLVRLDLSVDGEVIIEGRAERWTATHVYVVVNDPRVPGRQVWVRAQDVKRRAPATEHP